MKPLHILIGGPSYAFQCDQRRADHNMMLAVALTRAGMDVGPCSHVACPVDLARHGVTGAALSSGADVLISSDSDTWVDDYQQVIEAIRYVLAERVPFVAFPTMRRNGTSNVRLLARPRQWTPKQLVPAGPNPVSSAGAAFHLLNLNVYRERWADGPWWKGEWRGAAPMGEDVWHCEQLHQRMNAQPIVWGDCWARHADGSRVL